MSRRYTSLQLRLSLELAALFLIATCLAVGGLIYSAAATLDTLVDRDLGLRAEDLARHVSLDDKSSARLDLPPGLKQAYDAAAQQSLFAIRDRDGHLVAASTPGIGAIAMRDSPVAVDAEPAYFKLTGFGPAGQDYSAIGIGLDSAAGPLSIVVAQVSGDNLLARSILREFVLDLAWYVPPFVAVALLLAETKETVDATRRTSLVAPLGPAQSMTKIVAVISTSASGGILPPAIIGNGGSQW